MSIMKTETKQPTFPYVSYPTFKAFIGHLHDTVVTDQIDNTMMPTTFPAVPARLLCLP
jgi:hypothetical protein